MTIVMHLVGVDVLVGVFIGFCSVLGRTRGIIGLPFLVFAYVSELIVLFVVH